MTDLFHTDIDILPDWLTQLNLLSAFIWYISFSFALSLVLRLRFYWSVYDVARYVSRSCPYVFTLVHEHWFLCVKDGIVLLVGLYAGILTVYVALNEWVWPLASISLLQLAEHHPGLLVAHLVLIGLMITVDTVLIAQVGVIDARRVKEDLRYAESWLGSELNHMLSFLGNWNPIKKYADGKAYENLRWFNDIFRTSLTLMIVQLGLRLFVAFSLFFSSVSERL